MRGGGGAAAAAAAGAAAGVAQRAPVGIALESAGERLVSRLGGVAADNPMPLPWKRTPLKDHRAQAPGQALCAQVFG